MAMIADGVLSRAPSLFHVDKLSNLTAKLVSHGCGRGRPISLPKKSWLLQSLRYHRSPTRGKETYEQHQWQSLCDECHHADEAVEDLGGKGNPLCARACESAATGRDQPLVHRICALGGCSPPWIPFSWKRAGTGKPQIRLPAVLLEL